MDRSEIIALIATRNIKDEFGVARSVESSRTVFCAVQSVTRDEFYEGGRNGLNPEYQFTMFAPDYAGERVLEYKGNRYGIYRTYIGRNDTIELYAERKGGTNGKDNGG